MMKLRPIPIIITAVVSACLLVGGWYVYRNVASVQPLEKITADIRGVQTAKPDIGKDTVTMDVTLASDANIREVYEKIRREGAAVIGSRELKLNVTDAKSSGKLDDVWASMLFKVAEAMEHRKYSEIPAAMQAAQKQFPGIEASSEMDDTNVYITLKEGDAVKHLVLPRTPDEMGVWPNA